MKRILHAACLLSLLLAGCAPSLTSTNIPAPGTKIMEVSTPAAHRTTGTASTTVSPLPLGTAQGDTVTPTPDLRLPPERWQEWPVVPAVSARAREIYQRGLALGNDPRAFSKIGDCQSIPATLMGIYDTDRYSFAPEYRYLQETVDYFAGSFTREGESVRGGFNTSSVLLPFWANAEVCQPGENPMACENRIHNPSLVFISLEVWFEGRTPDVYEGYLRRIIEYNIEQGTLPVLATKADNVEGDHSINSTIARLAYEYDLPLWNYWLAVQPLPNHGLDPTDPTGFHLNNVDGWNMRSFSALQVLDAVHRATMGLTADGTPLATSSASTSAPALSFTPGPVSGLPFSRVDSVSSSSAPASLLFGFSTRLGAEIVSAGIFQGDLNGNDWLSLAGTGMTLLDRSNAGILAAQGNELYLVMDAQPILITDQLFPDTKQAAILLPDGRIVAILQGGEGNQLVIFSEDVPQYISVSEIPQILYPSRDPNRIYWGAGQCDDLSCPVEQIISTTLADLVSTILPYEGQPTFAADGKMAFLSRAANGTNQLTLVDGDQTRTFPIFGNRLVDMSWSPDGSTLAISLANVSDYSGLVLKSRLYFVSWSASVDQVLDLTDETIECQVWSPDGMSLLVITRKVDGQEYHLNYSVLDAAGQQLIPALGFDLVSDEYLLLQRVFWIP